MSLLSLITSIIAVDKNCIPRRQIDTCLPNIDNTNCNEGVCSKTTSDALYGLSILGLFELFSIFSIIFMMINIYLRKKGYIKLVILNIVISVTFFIYNLYNNSSNIHIYNNKLNQSIKDDSIGYIVFFMFLIFYISIVLIYIINKEKLIKTQIKPLIKFLAKLKTKG